MSITRKFISQLFIGFGVLLLAGCLLVPPASYSLRAKRTPDGSYVRDTNGELVFDKTQIYETMARHKHYQIVMLAGGAFLICAGYICEVSSNKNGGFKHDA
jgi:hypothetical protein